MPNVKLSNYIHLHLIVFIWGFTAILGELISIKATRLVWYRMGLASVFMLAFILSKRLSLKISFRQVLLYSLGGIIIAIHWITFFYAIKISNVSIGSIQEVKSWIWFPKDVEFFDSKDGENYTSIGLLNNDFSVNEYGSFVKDFEVVLDHPITTKYIKVKATNFGKCPEWHLGYGGDTWLFFDEIVIE